MLTAGLNPPEIAALNVLMSGMLASAWPTGTFAKVFQFGTACLEGVTARTLRIRDLGQVASAPAAASAYAVTASGTDRAIAAIPAAAPMALLVRDFTYGSSALQVAWHVKASGTPMPK